MEMELRIRNKNTITSIRDKRVVKVKQGSLFRVISNNRSAKTPYNLVLMTLQNPLFLTDSIRSTAVTVT